LIDPQNQKDSAFKSPSLLGRVTIGLHHIFDPKPGPNAKSTERKGWSSAHSDPLQFKQRREDLKNPETLKNRGTHQEQENSTGTQQRAQNFIIALEDRGTNRELKTSSFSGGGN